MAAVALTGLILFVLLVADFLTDRALAALSTSQPLKIKVTGHQWWWEVSYEAAVPSQTMTTANELPLPVGQPVRLELTSHDVIHSFWVPNLHGKKDLIPGYITTLWLQADQPGVFRGQCAEFCGHQHAHMAFLVFPSHRNSSTPGYLAGWVIDAQHLKPGNKMPPHSLVPGDLQALLA